MALHVGLKVLLDQLQPLQTCMPVLADDDVVVHGNAERGAIWTIALVIWMSACDGVGSPGVCINPLCYLSH
jgi:hypothetical protein